MAITACSSKRSDADALRKAAAVSDSTIYVQLDAVNEDSVNVTMTEDGSNAKLSIKKAMANGNVAGELNPGDTLAIMTGDDGHTVVSAVNMTQIVGQWMFAGTNGDGMRIASDGGASYIGAEQVTLRSWRISNGRFYLSYIKPDGRDYDEKPVAVKIDNLTGDSLVFVFMNETRRCSRSTGLITKD